VGRVTHLRGEHGTWPVTRSQRVLMGVLRDAGEPLPPEEAVSRADLPGMRGWLALAQLVDAGEVLRAGGLVRLPSSR